MAKYYYNGNAIVTPFTVISNKPVFASDTVSLKHIRSQQSAQRWELQFNIITNDNVANTLISVLDEMEAVSTMIMPQLPEVDAAATNTGVATLSVLGEVNDSIISLDTSTCTGLLPKGSFVKLGTHSKIYIVKADVDMTGATASMNIYPQLTVESIVGTSLQTGASVLLPYYRDVNTLSGVRYMDGVLADVGPTTVIEAL